MKKALKEKLQARLNKALEPPRTTLPKQDNSDAIVTRYAPPSEASLVNSAPSKTTSLDTNASQDQPMARLVSMTSLADMTGLKDSSLDLMSSLPDADGYTKLWHQMTDHLYGQLTTTEQAVHIQLFRLSWGFNKSSCLIALPKLAQRTNSSERTVQRALEGLIKKGLVRKARIVQGRDKIQGIEYEVTPPPSLAKSARQAKMTSLDKMATIKETHIKETHTNTEGVRVSSRFTLAQCRRYADSLRKNGITNPGGYATKIHRSGEVDELIEMFLSPTEPPAKVDTSQCPDCHGTGFYYPQGTSSGVAKCKHEQLSVTKEKGTP